MKLKKAWCCWGSRRSDSGSFIGTFRGEAGVRLLTRSALLFLAAATLVAGPSEFGQQELRAALAERGLTLNITTELNLDQPETFQISSITSTSVRISGGDLRGLMYGLMEAAEQVRTTGKLTAITGEPGLRLRAVRIAPLDTDLVVLGFYSV